MALIATPATQSCDVDFEENFRQLFIRLGCRLLPLCLLERACIPQAEWAPTGELHIRTPSEAGVPLWIIRHIFHEGGRPALQSVLGPEYAIGQMHVSVKEPSANGRTSPTKNLSRHTCHESNTAMVETLDTLCLIAHCFPDAYAEVGWEEIDYQLWPVVKSACIPVIDTETHELIQALKSKSQPLRDNIIRFLLRVLFYLSPNYSGRLDSFLEAALHQSERLTSDRVGMYNAKLRMHRSFNGISTVGSIPGIEKTAVAKMAPGVRATMILVTSDLGSKVPSDVTKELETIKAHWRALRKLTPMEILARASIITRESQEHILKILDAANLDHEAYQHTLAALGFIFSRRDFPSLAMRMLIMYLDRRFHGVVPTSQSDNYGMVKSTRDDSFSSTLARILSEYMNVFTKHEVVSKPRGALDHRVPVNIWRIIQEAFTVLSKEGELPECIEIQYLRVALADFYLGWPDLERTDLDAIKRLLESVMRFFADSPESTFVAAALRLSKMARREGDYKQVTDTESPLWKAAMSTGYSDTAKLAITEEAFCCLLNVDAENDEAARNAERLFNVLYPITCTTFGDTKQDHCRIKSLEEQKEAIKYRLAMQPEQRKPVFSAVSSASSLVGTNVHSSRVSEAASDRDRIQPHYHSMVIGPQPAAGTLRLQSQKEGELFTKNQVFGRKLEHVERTDLVEKPLTGNRANRNSELQEQSKTRVDPWEEVDTWQEKTVLSFDGGGVKSYASLLLLKRLMEEVANIETHHLEGAHESSFWPKKDIPRATENSEGHYQPQNELSGFIPAHYFDFCCGTSTGGLNAIMLGRLRMSVDECIREYPEMARNIFSNPRISFKGLRGPKYDASNLENEIKKIVAKRKPTGTTNREFSRYPSPKDLCKTLVISKAIDKTQRAETVFLFRTYDHIHISRELGLPINNPGEASNHEIWEVARATSAAPGYFEPISIEGTSYSDCAAGFNNPAQEAYDEIYLKEHSSIRFRDGSPHHPLQLLVSIGTGGKPDPVDKLRIKLEQSPKLFKRVRAITSRIKPIRKTLDLVHRAMDRVTVEKGVDRTMRRTFYEADRTYHRWQLGPDVGALEFDEWEESKHGKPSTQERIQNAVGEYIGEEEAQTAIRACAQQLVDIRRSRIRTDPMRWRRFAHCIRFRCPFCIEIESEHHDFIIWHIQKDHRREYEQRDVETWKDYLEVDPEFPGGPF